MQVLHIAGSARNQPANGVFREKRHGPCLEVVEYAAAQVVHDALARTLYQQNLHEIDDKACKENADKGKANARYSLQIMAAQGHEIRLFKEAELFTGYQVECAGMLEK
jgi:hypothetical protein